MERHKRKSSLFLDLIKDNMFVLARSSKSGYNEKVHEKNNDSEFST